MKHIIIVLFLLVIILVTMVGCASVDFMDDVTLTHSYLEVFPYAQFVNLSPHSLVPINISLYGINTNNITLNNEAVKSPDNLITSHIINGSATFIIQFPKSKKYKYLAMNMISYNQDSSINFTLVVSKDWSLNSSLKEQNWR